MMMHTKITMINNNNAQVERMNKLQGLQGERNAMHLVNDAKQKASIMQQQQLNSMKR
jgi:hypothetical protein